MSLRPLKQIAVPLLAVLHLASVHAQPREQLLIDGPAVVMPLVAALAKDFEQQFGSAIRDHVGLRKMRRTV